MFHEFEQFLMYKYHTRYVHAWYVHTCVCVLLDIPHLVYEYVVLRFYTRWWQ